MFMKDTKKMQGVLLERYSAINTVIGMTSIKVYGGINDEIKAMENCG